MRYSRGLKPFASLVLFTSLASCGQDPAFLNVDRGQQSSIVPSRSADASADDEQAIDNFDDDDDQNSGGGIIGDVIGNTPNPNNGSTDDNSDDVVTGGGGGPTGGGGGTGGGGTGGTGGSGIDPDDYVIPGVTGEDLASVKRCLAKWDQVPFPRTINNVKKLVAVSVNGFGNPINDTQATASPFLTLIYAGVNVGGAVTYNMLNPNGWYCMITNVNVNTSLDINLNCNARLADSLVGVNVGSTMTDNTARIGVHVNSQVRINTIRPNGQECVR